jgi:flagellar protein FlbT
VPSRTFASRRSSRATQFDSYSPSLPADAALAVDAVHRYFYGPQVDKPHVGESSMPLKLTLKPNEKVLIGTSVIANGPAKTEFVVLNRVPVVREKDIITEEKADTVAKKLYVTILNMYINPAREKDYHGIYFALMRQMILVPMDVRGVDLMVEMSQHILGADHYRALKLCRQLIKLEAEALANVKR